MSGKKSELPLARYVCDFLRATIFASDPYVLAVAWLWNSGHQGLRSLGSLPNEFRKSQKVLKQKVLLKFFWGSFLAAAEGVRIRSREEQVRRRRTSPRAAHQHFGESLGEVPWANSGWACVQHCDQSTDIVSMIVCHSMSYLSFSFCAFSSTGCFFDFDNVRQNWVLDVIVFLVLFGGSKSFLHVMAWR